MPPWVDGPHSNHYNMDNINKEKTRSYNNMFNRKWWKWTFIHKSLEKARRPPPKNPYKIKPTMQLFESLSQKIIDEISVLE